MRTAALEAISGHLPACQSSTSNSSNNLVAKCGAQLMSHLLSSSQPAASVHVATRTPRGGSPLVLPKKPPTPMPYTPVVAPPRTQHTAGLQRRGLGAPPPPPPPASADASEAAAAAAAESLRLAVALLRERCAVGLAPRERLWSLLVQWLALRDFTFNQLQDLL